MEASIKAHYSKIENIKQCVKLYNDTSENKIEIVSQKENVFTIIVKNTDQIFKLGQIYERFKPKTNANSSLTVEYGISIQDLFINQ